MMLGLKLDDMVDVRHSPVMLPEVLEMLKVEPGGRYIDATCGEGGHAQALLQASTPAGQVLAFDADGEGLAVARERLAEYGSRFIPVSASYTTMRERANELDFVPAHGILFDLGTSSLQLDVEQRGFSFRRAAPLDMRFSVEQALTAGDVVNTYSEAELIDILFRFGEESAARSIAAAIVARRPFSDTLELAEAVAGAVRRRRATRIHPATKTFQAIRIAVNDELNNLSDALEQALMLLGLGARLAVISYHSLEDRIVKHLFRRESRDCICPKFVMECACNHRATVRPVSKGVVLPSRMESHTNRRSRSAKLRVVERV